MNNNGAFQARAAKVWLLGTLTLSSAALLPAATRLSPAEFPTLHALIKPKSTEQKWAEIPWLASLWEARQVAAAQGKPILLWEMDGHPLGCT